MSAETKGRVLARVGLRYVVPLAVLVVGNAGLGRLAVAENVAGALLSPGGASVSALGIAALFLLTRFAAVGWFVFGAASVGRHVVVLTYDRLARRG